MVMSHEGLRLENDCADEGQQEIVNDRSVLFSDINKPATLGQ
jgi:hypothetical protein